MKFTHEESGSTITLAADGTISLKAVGNVKQYLAPASRGSEVANALKGKLHADKLLARMKKGAAPTLTVAADDGDEVKKWEGITLAILKAIGTSSLTAQQIADAVGRDLADVQGVLDEMEAQKGAAKLADGKWSLTAEAASLLAKQPA